MAQLNVIKEFDILAERLADYGQHALKYYQYVAFENSARLLSRILAKGIVAVTILMVTMFLSFWFAFFLGEITGRISTGFLVVSGLYLLLGILFYYLRVQWIVNPIIRDIAELSQELKKEIDEE